MIPVYVIGHPDREPERYKYLSSVFHEWNLQVEWIQPTYKTTLTAEQTDRFVSCMTNHGRPLKPAEQSIFLNIVAVLETYVKTDAEFCLILESDVIFERPLNEYLSSLQGWIQTVNPDCASLGSGCDLIHDDVDTDDMNFQIYPKRLVRCMDTLLFSKRGAQTFLHTLHTYGKWDEPIDNFFETFLKTHPEFTFFWVWPSLTLQGSQYGYYPTTIQDSS